MYKIVKINFLEIAILPIYATVAKHANTVDDVSIKETKII